MASYRDKYLFDKNMCIFLCVYVVLRYERQPISNDLMHTTRFSIEPPAENSFQHFTLHLDCYKTVSRAENGVRKWEKKRTR